MTGQEPFAFHREHDGSLSVEAAVYQALGAASTCWENMAGTGVFDDTRAREVAEALLALLRGPEGVRVSLDVEEAQLAAWALREVRGWPVQVEGDWERMVTYSRRRDTLAARLSRESVGIR